MMSHPANYRFCMAMSGLGDEKPLVGVKSLVLCTCIYRKQFSRLAHVQFHCSKGDFTARAS